MDNDVIKTVYASLWQDPELRVKALSDGNAAIEEITGTRIGDVKYVFHENSDTVVHLPIPVRPPELSNRDLNLLAQGKGAAAGDRGFFDIIKKILPIAGNVITSIGGAMNK